MFIKLLPDSEIRRIYSYKIFELFQIRFHFCFSLVEIFLLSPVMSRTVASLLSRFWLEPRSCSVEVPPSVTAILWAFGGTRSCTRSGTSHGSDWNWGWHRQLHRHWHWHRLRHWHRHRHRHRRHGVTGTHIWTARWST